MIYRVGQVWERDGKQRRIDEIRLFTVGGYRVSVDSVYSAPCHESDYEIRWSRPDGKQTQSPALAVFHRWAQGAKLVGGEA